MQYTASTRIHCIRSFFAGNSDSRIDVQCQRSDEAVEFRQRLSATGLMQLKLEGDRTVTVPVMASPGRAPEGVVVVRLHGVPLSQCVEGIGELLLREYGLPPYLLESEYMPPIEGGSNVGRGGIVFLQIRTPELPVLLEQALPTSFSASYEDGGACKVSVHMDNRAVARPPRVPPSTMRREPAGGPDRQGGFQASPPVAARPARALERPAASRPPPRPVPTAVPQPPPPPPPPRPAVEEALPRAPLADVARGPALPKPPPAPPPARSTPPKGKRASKSKAKPARSPATAVVTAMDIDTPVPPPSDADMDSADGEDDMTLEQANTLNSLRSRPVNASGPARAHGQRPSPTARPSPARAPSPVPDFAGQGDPLHGALNLYLEDWSNASGPVIGWVIFKLHQLRPDIWDDNRELQDSAYASIRAGVGSLASLRRVVTILCQCADRWHEQEGPDCVGVPPRDFLTRSELDAVKAIQAVTRQAPSPALSDDDAIVDERASRRRSRSPVNPGRSASQPVRVSRRSRSTVSADQFGWYSSRPRGESPRRAPSPPRSKSMSRRGGRAGRPSQP